MIYVFRLLCAVAVALGVTFAVPLRAEPSRLAQTDFAPYSGSLLYLDNGQIWRLDLTTNEQRLLVQVPGGLISHMAHSPDGQRVAYAVTYYDDLFRVRASEIMICDAEGNNPQTVVHEEDPGFYVGWVSWPNDPTRLVYSKVNWGRGFTERVEEVDLGTGARSLLVERASAPSASPTAPAVAYQTRAGQKWNIQKLDRQSGAKTELVKADWFDDADHPTFSPDGSSIAFVAAGAGPLPGADAPSLLSNLFAIGRPSVASAHDLIGVLFDVWVMQPNGEGLHRLAPLFDVQPEIAWSPTGRHIAALGSFQLQIVDVATGATRGLPKPQANSPFGSPLSWVAG